jgi:hypothetical protein
MAGNESDSAYSPPNGVASISSITLRQLIAEGGSHLFKSAGHINQFFSLIEASEVTGPDYKTLQKTLNASIYYMEQARAVYFQLKTQAGATPYNQEVIYLLIGFDYDTFCEENGLLPYVFSKVKKLLSVGDVTGVYHEFHSYSCRILEVLYTIKREVDSEIFPDLSNPWCVNQEYAEFKLFGQYVANVFYSIK